MGVLVELELVLPNRSQALGAVRDREGPVLLGKARDHQLLLRSPAVWRQGGGVPQESGKLIHIQTINPNHQVRVEEMK